MFESYRDDPLCQAVERAVAAGLVVVAAAGNIGKTDDGRPVVGGIISPGNYSGGTDRRGAEHARHGRSGRTT